MSNVGRYFLPYCVQPLTDDHFVILNRQYKPLGFREGWFEYDKYAERLPGMTLADLARPDSLPGLCHLYRDPFTWADYLPRFSALEEWGARLPHQVVKTDRPRIFQVLARDGSALGAPIRLSRAARESQNLRNFSSWKVPV